MNKSLVEYNLCASLVEGIKYIVSRIDKRMIIGCALISSSGCKFSLFDRSINCTFSNGVSDSIAQPCKGNSDEACRETTAQGEHPQEDSII
jgi:hypothetical protein